MSLLAQLGRMSLLLEKLEPEDEKQLEKLLEKYGDGPPGASKRPRASPTDSIDGPREPQPRKKQRAEPQPQAAKNKKKAAGKKKEREQKKRRRLQSGGRGPKVMGKGGPSPASGAGTQAPR